MKKLLSLLLLAAMLLALCACAASPAQPTGETTAANPQETSSETSSESSTLVYGSGDYTRINPAMDEHCEINLLLFDGLTAHDGENNVVPGLAESWDFDEQLHLPPEIRRHVARWGALHRSGRKVHDRSHHESRQRLGERAEL